MPSVLQPIQQAAKERKLLEIAYRDSKGAITNRVVESYEIKNGIIFYGFDVEKGEIRSFKLNSILKAEVLEDSYVPQWPIKI